MKKFFLCSLLIFASAFAFADKNRFYEDDRLIDNMYVDASSGLRVRDKPDLSGKKKVSLNTDGFTAVILLTNSQ